MRLSAAEVCNFKKSRYSICGVNHWTHGKRGCGRFNCIKRYEVGTFNTIMFTERSAVGSAM